MKRALLFSLVTAAATGGCGSGTTPTTDGSMMMEGDMAVAPTPDMTTPKPDMAVPPPEGTKIVAGTYFLYGITDDNQAVAIDLKNNNALVAVPVTGNKAATISPGGWSMAIHGSTVFDWEGTDQATNVGQANVWTVAGGLKGLSKGDASIAGIGSASDDSKWLYYSGGAAIDGTTTDLYVSKVDTTGALKVATGGLVDTTNDPAACTTHAIFTPVTNKLIATVCGQGDPQMGGIKGNSLVSIDPATGMSTPLYGNIGIWSAADPTGKWVAAADSADKLYLFPVAGGMPVAVDTDVKDSQVAFLPDGSAMLYITNGGQLKRATVGASPAPMTLVAANVSIFRRYNLNRRTLPAMSPDGKWVIVSNQYDTQSGIGDIFMASTSVAGMPTTLVADATGEIFGDAFTQDNAYALYYTKTAQVGSGLIGTFTVKPIAGGGAPVEIAQKVWVSYDGLGSISGYNDNYKSGKGVTGDYGTADLKIVDVKDPLKIKTVALKADAEFWPTPDRKTFVFSTRVSTTTSGMYSIPAMP